MNDLSIIIVTYNSSSTIRDCLNHINNSKDISPERLIIDSGSSDSTLSIVKSEYPGWSIVKSDKNGGFGHSANIGISKSNGSYALVMNPDVFVEPETIYKLFEFIKSNSDVGVCSSKLINYDGTLQRSFRKFPSYKYIFLRILDKLLFNKGRSYSYEYLMSDDDPDKTKDVDWLIGSFLMIRRSALDKIGLFDEKYFLYCEDIDLCARMKNGGWRVTYAPVAKAVHKHEQMSFKKPFSGLWYYHLTSMLRFLAKQSQS